MFNNDFFIKRKMERAQMERFAQCLGDIWRDRALSNSEGRILLRKKLVMLAQDRYDLTNEDYSYIGTLVDSIFEKDDESSIIENANMVVEQISLI